MFDFVTPLEPRNVAYVLVYQEKTLFESVNDCASFVVVHAAAARASSAPTMASAHARNTNAEELMVQHSNDTRNE